MNKTVSIIIPSRNEQFMQNTVNDLLAKACGDIEVIVVLDGHQPDVFLGKDKRIKVIRERTPKGLRAAINSAVKIAKGKFIMKLDAHCALDQDFDTKLKADCKDNWLVIPRRYSLDAERWERRKLGSFVDYECYTYPYYKPPHIGFYNIWWNERRNERRDNPKYLIDDTMAFQGSCWFSTLKHFQKTIVRMDAEWFGMWAAETQELGMKTWLSGGRVVVNKKTWYAHLHKGRKYGRGYFMNTRLNAINHARTVDFWMNNQWKDRIHDFEWMIDKFWPVPTWPDDWKEQIRKNPIPSWKEIVKINQGG